MASKSLIFFPSFDGSDGVAPYNKSSGIVVKDSCIKGIDLVSDDLNVLGRFWSNDRGGIFTYNLIVFNQRIISLYY